MNNLWRKRLPPLCGGLGCALLAGAAWVCTGLTLGGGGDRLFVALTLLTIAALAEALIWFESRRPDWVLLALLPVGAAILIRALCLDHTSLDYKDFLSQWYVYFKSNGGFDAVKDSVGDYNVPYLYFMAAISYSDVPDLYLIKLFSILWDVLLAWGCLRLVRSLMRERQGSTAPLIAFGAALLLPTVALNGAYWGQCDVIYATLCVHAAALTLDGKHKAAIALMGAAFSFKLQAIFVLPLWGVLWLAKKVKFWELWAFPLAYFGTIIPALLMGKPLGDILGVYLNQMGEYPRLVLNAPSVYQFIPYGTQLNEALAAKLGIAAAGALVLALLGLGFWLGNRLDRELVMTAAVVLCVGVPFFLPHMHERYFFLADVFTLCWACANVRRVPAAVLAEGSSLASYLVYLRLKYNCVLTLGGCTFVMPLEALAMLAALVFAVWVLTGQVRKRKNQEGLA
ncbi:MAG: conjugal transfer protein TraL [Oscillospiraceae bacterium]|nr:conjugal transfer protein TraL [Oscillospiraceae bacterium]